MLKSFLARAVKFAIKARAFISRDFFIAKSYRTVFIMNLASIFFSAAIFFFISKTFGGNSPVLRPYGGEYFPFIIIGLAFFNYLFTGLGSFSKSIREEQLMGTIEAILISPTRLSSIIILTSIWSFVYSSLIVLAYLIFGLLFFGLTIKWIELFVCLIILIPSIVTFGGLGIIAAAFVLVFKRNDPIKWLLSLGSSLLGGVFFPISVLPLGLQELSKFMPVTYSLRALRMALLQNASLLDLLPDLAVLLLFCLVILPLSILIFKLAVIKVKRDGALAYY